MPVVAPLIAAVAAAAASAGVSGALAGAVAAGLINSFAATLISGLVGAIVSFAVSYVGSALLGSGSKSKSGQTADSAADRTQQVRQAVAPHRIILGSVKVSGVIVYIYSNLSARPGFPSMVKGGESADFKPEQLLYVALVLSGHQPGAIAAVTEDAA